MSTSPLRPQTSGLPLSAQSPAQPLRQTSNYRRIVRILLLIFAFLLLYKVAAIGYYGWQLYRSTQTLRLIATVPTLESIATEQNVNSAQSALRQFSGSMTGLERELRFAAPLLHRLRGVPQVGALLASTPELLIAGKEFSAILSESAEVIAPSLIAKKPLLGQESVVSSFSSAKTQFAVMSQQATVANLALQQVDLAALHPTLAANQELLQTLLRVLPAVFQIAPSIPHLIGSDTPQTYLLLIQNNHELRATGGFITAVGRVRLDDGALAEMDFTDSYSVYVDGNQYPNAPAAQQKYMGIPILLFRDGNWSPDLPTSAQTLKALYFQDMGVAVNGIITVDINAVQALVDALGPLQMEGSDEAITGKNIVDFLKQLWAQPLTTEGTVDEEKFDVEWWKRRKDFVPLLASAVLKRVQSGEFDKLAVVDAALRSLDQRFVQVWVDDADAAKALAWQGWDGGLEPEANADFLALVDSNMGYNKVDSVLSRELDYRLVWATANNGVAQATVTIVYEHPFAVPEEDNCNQTPRYGNSYDEMAARCYFDYVRLYTPAGSKLVKAEGFADDTVETLRGEKGTQIFVGYFVMKPGTQHVVRFTYTLPSTIGVNGYRLVLQKQSGLVSLPVTLDINGRTVETIVSDGVFRWHLQ